jgi:hypothetical protein
VSKSVGYVLMLFLSLKVKALVPVEGILMGEARGDIQQDPLHFIFRDQFDTTQSRENKKIKLYHATYTAGAHLTESCHLYGPITYSSTWKENQARRSVAATLQYYGLDMSIKAIGAYAHKLNLSELEFTRLSSNLVRNYCSKNMTILSGRNVELSLQHYFQNPEEGIIPTAEGSPFATMSFKNRTETPEARSVELDYAISAFRSFCSWGNEVDDYRMLGPYLKNHFIMAIVIKNILGIQDSYVEQTQKVIQKDSSATVQVACEDLICRKVSKEDFMKKFPLSVGSTGLDTDLAKLYCNHFRFQDYHSADAIVQVKQWIKESDLEDPVFETSFFISLMSGIPDPFFGTEKYVDLSFLAKSSIDERWNNWAKDVVGVFSKDLLFEESLKVSSIPIRESSVLRNEGFRLKFNVTLGELDRVLQERDKLNAIFEFKLSKNYLRSLRVRWVLLLNEVDLEGQRAFKQDIAAYLDLQLRKKEKLFLQKIWSEEFSRLMADELLEQVLAYRGPLFDSYRDQVLTVPVELNYGLLALSYLRYRADVKAERLKFKF